MTQEPILQVAFVDRDGTINVDRGCVHRIEDWEFTPSACQALAVLRDAGFRIAVVTNQSGVAAGFYSAAEVDQLHAFMCQQLSEAGVLVDAVVYCPHAPNGACNCRKPRTGMARIVEAKLGSPIDYGKSWMIGDKPSDVEFGKALGTKTALIRSRYWSDAESAGRGREAEKGTARSRLGPPGGPLTPALSPELLAGKQSMSGESLEQIIRGRGGNEIQDRADQVEDADVIVDSLFEAAQRIAVIENA